MQLIKVESFTEGPSIRVATEPVPDYCVPVQCVSTRDATTQLMTAQPDARWQVMDGGVCSSRCALWWRESPPLSSHRVGLIGSFAADNEHSAKTLLGHACEQLRTMGCTLAVGPMDGNTWGNYRFVTEFGERPPFWMEPSNPPAWPQHFTDFGFRPLAQYFSAVNRDLEYRDPRLSGVARRLDGLGVQIRPISSASFADDVRQVYEVARVAFQSNLLYTTLDGDVFYQQTLPLRELVPLELSWLAERDGRAIGFLFAVPDLYEPARGERPQTIVVKTLATIPDRAYAGLGQLLLAKAHHQALDLGFTQAIHALLRDKKSLRRISGKYARQIRGYTLFAKVLAR